MAVRRVCRFGMFLGSVAMVLAAMLPLSAPGQACACGAAIAPSGGSATMNHEVALVHWNGATETVVMQLVLDATTDNVALVVPTPTPATVAAADKATFTELDRLTAPQIRHQRHWTLGTGPASAQEGALAGARAPDVVSRVRLGPLEVTTLAGGDLDGLQKWLADNGYAVRPAVLQAMHPYVRDGWSFVAIRLTGTAPIVGGLDPVRLTFGSPNLVYPMRLSVAAPQPQHVTVFTLSDHRQQRTDADKSTQTTTVGFAGRIPGETPDPLLRELTADHGSYVTKTQVDIARPSSITTDFTFGDAANDDPYRQVIVLNDDVAVPPALGWLAGFAVTVTVAAVVLLVVVRRNRRRRSMPLG